MSDIEALDTDIAAADREVAPPARSPWRRYEATVLGAGSIVLLLVVWEEQFDRSETSLDTALLSKPAVAAALHSGAIGKNREQLWKLG